MSLLLKKLIWYHGDIKISGDVRIDKGILETAETLCAKKSEQVTEFNDHFLYPGLINAHDHLEMNLYPLMGTPPYANYVEWGRDIYKPAHSPVKEIEKVDIKDRLLWGGLKNLISGATTVVHHNPWHRVLGKTEFPVNVLKEMAWAHSLAFGKNIERAFPRNQSVPFVIHAAEGTDAVAFSEITRLEASGLLRKNTVLIHAVAVDDTSMNKIRDQQASVVWCPASNFFLFEKTAPIEKMMGSIKIAIGSDSTLTGSPTLLDEMRVALRSKQVTAKDVFEMVTYQPANIFHLPVPQINANANGNFFVTPVHHHDYFENLMLVKPSDIMLVAVRGRVCLHDPDIRMNRKPLKHSCEIDGHRKQIEFDVGSLKKRIAQKIGASTLDKNPLWLLIDV